MNSFHSQEVIKISKILERESMREVLNKLVNQGIRSAWNNNIVDID